MTIHDTETLARGTISNTCLCEPEDGYPECSGECYEDDVYFWNLALTETMDADFGNGQSVWRVSGFPVWNGATSGIAVIRTTDDLLRALTVRGEWRLEWRVISPTTISLTIWHHDAPMGGSFTATFDPDTMPWEV